MKASRASVRASFAGDASGPEGVAFERQGDTCDTSDPNGTAPGALVAGQHGTAVGEGVSSGPRGGVRRAARRGTGGPRALLDYSLRDTAPGQHAPDEGALDRWLRWLVLAYVAPALDAARPAGLRLASVSLTGPDEHAIPEAVGHFAHAMVDHPLAGVLLARDVGEEHGRAHYHGLALARSLDRLRDHWAEFVGRGANEARLTPVDRWRDFCEEPYEQACGPHLCRIVQYAFKPWPAEHGRRSVERDTLASGAFVAPLRAVRAAVARGYPLTLESPVEASPTCRPCLLCGRPLPAGARIDKVRHDRCRKRASKAKRKAEREAEGQGEAEEPPDGAP